MKIIYNKHIPFEREAYDNERKPTYLSSRVIRHKEKSLLGFSMLSKDYKNFI